MTVEKPDSVFNKNQLTCVNISFVTGYYASYCGQKITSINKEFYFSLCYTLLYKFDLKVKAKYFKGRYAISV